MAFYAIDSTLAGSSGAAPVVLVESAGDHNSDAIVSWDATPPVRVGSELRSAPGK